MDFDDLLKMRGLENMDEKKDHSGRWSENTALWAIVIAIVIIAWLWFVHRQGADKADLAAAVQSSVSRLNALENTTAAQGQNLYSINSVLSATTQAVGDFKAVTNQQLAALDGAVFVPRCGNSRSCGSGTQFVKRDNYCLSDSSLQAIDTCG